MTLGRHPVASATTAWTALYIGLWSTGQRFSTNFLDIGWQLVPRATLRDDPFGSVWYLHVQPPLWNLTLGVVMRWSPLPDSISLQLLLLALAMATVAMLASLLFRLTSNSWLAIGGSLVAMADPQVLANLTQPTYEMVTTFGLVTVVWLVVHQPRSPRFTLVAVVIAGTAIVMIRTVFHPIWLVVLVGACAWMYRDRLAWRTVALVCLIPIATIGGWMLKNEVVFGRATLSSWSGMNLQRAVVQVATDSQLAEWSARGEISELSVAFPGGFRTYPEYAELVEPCVARHSHPAVAALWRDDQHFVPNYNAECFLPIFDQAGRDARAVILHHPAVFLEGRWWAARAWFVDGGLPAAPVSSLYQPLRSMYRVLDLAVPARLPSTRYAGSEFGVSSGRVRPSLSKIAFTILVLGAGLRAGIRRLRRLPTSRFAAVEMIAALIVGWSMAIGVLFELGEQMRFRTMTDPITTALGIWLCARLIAHVRERSGDRGGPPIEAVSDRRDSLIGRAATGGG